MISNIKYKQGFSLIEVLVSTALFVVIITSAMNIFKIVIESQRSAIATQNVEESLKYFLEVVGKEVRMAKRNNHLCSYLGLETEDIYKLGTNIDGETLSFRNHQDNCVTYSLVASGTSTRFMITRDSLTGYFITPLKVNIDELNFALSTTTQPTVTMELVAHALGKDTNQSEMRIQTTLSSRYYKKD
jgi:prepilin-type N-terminal cleavage/methylation domain-containing protein